MSSIGKPLAILVLLAAFPVPAHAIPVFFSWGGEIAHFCWSEAEIEWLLASIPQQELQRGCPGQDLYSILCKDPDIERKMMMVANRALLVGNEDVAYYAMYLTIYWAGKGGLARYQEFLAMNPGFRKLELSEDVESCLKQHVFRRRDTGRTPPGPATSTRATSVWSGPMAGRSGA